MQSVKHFLLDSRWRQTDLAAALGIHYSHVSLLLAGKRMPSVELLRKMSDVTSIPIERLVQESGQPPPRKKPLQNGNGRKGKS